MRGPMTGTGKFSANPKMAVWFSRSSCSIEISKMSSMPVISWPDRKRLRKRKRKRNGKRKRERKRERNGAGKNVKGKIKEGKNVQQILQKPDEECVTNYTLLNVRKKDINNNMPYHTISYHMISCPFTSYHIISYHITSYRTISYHHIIWYHIISYHIISYHIIPDACSCL